MQLSFCRKSERVISSPLENKAFVISKQKVKYFAVESRFATMFDAKKYIAIYTL